MPLKVYIYILTAQRIGRMLSCTCVSFKYPLTNRAYMSSYFIKKKARPHVTPRHQKLLFKAIDGAPREYQRLVSFHTAYF